MRNWRYYEDEINVAAVAVGAVLVGLLLWWSFS